MSDIRERIKQMAAAAAPSMIPQAREQFIPPPEKVVEMPPDISEIVPDAKARVKLAQLVAKIGHLGLLMAPLSKDKKNLVAQAKLLTGKYRVARAICGEWRVNYFNQPRRSLSAEKLLAAGVSIDTINSCYEEKITYVLKISPATSEEMEGDE